MTKVSVRRFDDLTEEPGRITNGRVDLAITMQVAFASPKATIDLRLLRVPPRCRAEWLPDPHGHLIYIWSGTVWAGGVLLDSGSVVVVEHDASCEVRSGDGGAELLMFHPEASADAQRRNGGHVHILPAGDAPRVETMAHNPAAGVAMFADANCPTCALWLHENSLHEPGYQVDPHHHGEDEIIVVTGGEIVLGARRYGRGTAIAVARNTIYGFAAGEGGLRFINFRPGPPTYSKAGSTDAVDELQFYAELAPLRYHPLRLPPRRGAPPSLA